MLWGRRGGLHARREDAERFLEGDPQSEAQGGWGKGRDMEAKLGSRQCCQTGTGAIVLEIGIMLVD